MPVSVSDLIEMLSDSKCLLGRLERARRESAPEHMKKGFAEASNEVGAVIAGLQDLIANTAATSPREALMQVILMREWGDYIEDHQCAAFVAALSSVIDILSRDVPDAQHLVALAPHIPGQAIIDDFEEADSAMAPAKHAA